LSFSSAPRAVVVDASVAMHVLAGAPEWHEQWREWQEADAMLLAPAHFGVEVANASLRGARLSAADASSRLERLFSAGVEITDRGLPGLLEAVDLADRHHLTVYDALYLQLAADVDGELATLDRALADAAREEGISLSPGSAG